MALFFLRLSWRDSQSDAMTSISTKRVLGQSRGLHGGTRGRRGGEVSCVDFVHSREIVHVLQKHRGLHHMMEGSAGSFQDCLHILEHSFGLLVDVSAYEFSGFADPARLARKRTDKPLHLIACE